jgi:hypothetical protein
MASLPAGRASGTDPLVGASPEKHLDGRLVGFFEIFTVRL